MLLLLLLLPTHIFSSRLPFLPLSRNAVLSDQIHRVVSSSRGSRGLLRDLWTNPCPFKLRHVFEVLSRGMRMIPCCRLNLLILKKQIKNKKRTSNAAVHFKAGRPGEREFRPCSLSLPLLSCNSLLWISEPWI